MTRVLSADEIRRLVGRQVTVRLASQAAGAASLTGRITGLLEAADGLVVFLEPADSPGARRSFHHHDILEILEEEG